MAFPSAQALETAAKTLLATTHKHSCQKTGHDHTKSPTITSFDQYDADLEVAMYALKRSFAAHRAELRNQRNSLLKIHSLPTELVVYIFHASQPDRDSHEYYPNLAGLSLVYSRWHSIVESTPSLWSNVGYLHEPTTNSMALLKSKNYPLHVHFPRHSGSRAGRSFLEEAYNHIQRWESVTLNTYPALILFERLCSPAPVLQEASITLQPPHQEVFDLFGGDARRLHTLSISGLSIPWGTSMLCALRSLEIRNMHHPPQLTEIMGILFQSPELELLILDDIGLEDGTEMSATAVMPALRTLHLNGPNPVAACSLLSRIQAPSLTSFLLKFTTSGSLPPSLPTAIAPFFPPNGQSSKVGYIEVGSIPLAFHFRITEEETYMVEGPRVEILTMGASPTDMLNAVADALDPDVMSEMPTEVKFRNRFDFMDDDVLGPLSRFSSIITINLSERARGLRRLIEHLKTPKTDMVDGTRRWVFPKLRRLIMDQNDLTTTDILDMLRSRYSLLHLAKTSKHAHPMPEERPVSLYLLRVDNPTPRGFELRAKQDGTEEAEIVQIVEGECEGKVMWEDEEYSLEREIFAESDDDST